jgi:excisionase family DNA binding protein
MCMKNDETKTPFNIPSAGVDQNSLALTGESVGRDAVGSGRFAPSGLKAAKRPLLGPTHFGCRLAFSVQETAEMLGVSEKTVRRLIKRRLLHPSNALRHLLIPKKEIERFLAETSAQ